MKNTKADWWAMGIVTCAAVGIIISLYTSIPDTVRVEKPAVVRVEKPAAPKVPKYNEDDLRRATLDRMSPKVAVMQSWERHSQAEMDAARVKLKCFQDWVNTLQDEEVKSAYQQWIDWLNNNYDQIAINSKKSEPAEDPFMKELKQAKKRADALQIPKPPKAMCAVQEKP